MQVFGWSMSLRIVQPALTPSKILFIKLFLWQFAGVQCVLNDIWNELANEKSVCIAKHLQTVSNLISPSFFNLRLLCFNFFLLPRVYSSFSRLMIENTFFFPWICTPNLFQILSKSSPLFLFQQGREILSKSFHFANLAMQDSMIILIL